jgi:hypothetical protein
MKMAIELFAYVQDAVLGAIIYIFTAKALWGEGIPNMKLFVVESVKRILIAVVIGIVMFELQMPNHMVALTAGYMGIDFLEALMEKLKTSVGGAK